MAMKVVVYSNFPEALVAKDITPKLERFGVEVLGVVSADRGKVTDSAEADALVAMVEKMSNAQRDKVKAIAKAAGKPYYPLTRASSDWVKYFGEPGIPVITVAPTSSALASVAPQTTVLTPQARRGFAAVMPPPEVIRAASPPSPSPSVEFAKELKVLKDETKSEMKKFEGELLRLQHLLRKADEELRAQRAAVDKTRNERDQMTERCRALNKTIEDRNVELDKLKRTPTVAPELVGELEAARARLVELEADNASYMQMYEQSAAEYTKFKEERDAHKRGHEAAMKEIENLEELKARQATELYRLREESKKLKVPPTSGIDPKVVGEFFRVRDAFKLLWESKAMPADVILKQLFDWKGSE